MKVKYPQVGICGLSCMLCPRFYTNGSSRCNGCKTESRMGAGCPFITCAIKKKEIEFCWDCQESDNCKKWKKHRERGKRIDSFKCYQTLEKDISFIKQNGIRAFINQQNKRAKYLSIMITNYDDGRSKSFYCIAATVLDIDALKNALAEMQVTLDGLDKKSRAELMHRILNQVKLRKGYTLKLRK